MIKLKNITMRNFLSAGAVTLAVNLDNHGLTLVIGANADTGGRNGAGKSMILQALSFGLYGKPLSRIKLPNLINNINQKQMLVTVEFERDGKSYKIERGKKPDVMKFYINDTEIVDSDNEAQGENKHTQTEIERVVGMSHTMFKHIVALNTHTDPFLRMAVAQQREIIEELLGVSQISRRSDSLKTLIGNTKESMRDQKATITAIIEANSRIETAIKSSQSSSNLWEKQHNDTISKLSKQISEMIDIDYDAEVAAFDKLDAWLNDEKTLRNGFENSKREIALLSREITALEKDAANYLKDAVSDASGQESRLKSEIARKQAEILKIAEDGCGHNSELKRLEEHIANPGEQFCASCGQALEDTEHFHTVIGNLVASKNRLADAIEFDDRRIVSLQDEVKNIEQELINLWDASELRRLDYEGRASAKIELTLRPKEKLEVQQNIYREYVEKLSALGSRPDTMFSSRDEVYRAKQVFSNLSHELEVEASKENPYLSQIATLTATLQEVSYDALNDLDVLLKHQEFLLKLLTSKDSFIRKRIIDQNLSYLNNRMNHYLNKLGLPHEVKFLSDLSVDISLLGIDMDFEQLSRGESNRVILATSFSFRDVWESLNDNMNLLFLDEVSDQGIDDSGAETTLAVLKGMARDRGKNIFIISHKDSMTSRVDHILTVYKSDGFTRFEYE